MKKLLLVLLFVPLVSFGQSAEDYFNSAQKKDNLKDYKGAIADYTKVIELAPNNINSYYNRGTSKANLKDYKGAIADYTKAIELSPNFAAAYYNRGINKYYLKDIIGACKDAGKAKQFGYNASQLINETCGTPKFIINGQLWSHKCSSRYFSHTVMISGYFDPIRHF